MLILFCISLITGAVLFHIVGFSITEVIFVSLIVGAFFIIYFRNKKSIFLALAIVCSIVLGSLRFWIVPDKNIVYGSRAFTGVVRNVDERFDKTLVVIREDGTNIDVQASLYNKQNFLPGDKVSVRGIVEQAQDFVTDTDRVFDYDGYLESKGVEAIVKNVKITKTLETEFSITRWFANIRSFISRALSKNISFPVDGVVAGMLVGFQAGIPKYLSDIFRETGTLHTLVLSGYNITVLAGFLGLLLRRIPFRLRTLFIAIGIISLVLVSGAGVAAVRAGIMGSIALFAGVTLQNYQALRALLISALFFFLVSPMTIFVDPGFHLSFLATLFIITLLPILKNKFISAEKISNWKNTIVETLILAIGLPIFMLPYMMYFSGSFPLVSPVANIFLVPVIPILMLGGVFVIAFSFLPFIAGAIGLVTSFIGSIAIAILTFFSNFPEWQTPTLSGWLVILIYTILFIFIFKKDIKNYFLLLKNIFQRQTS